MLSGPTNAFTLDDVDIPPNTHTLDISVLESTPSYDVAGLTWLPKIKDSEVGPTGNDMGYNANQGADCSGYKYSTSNCKANNQEPLGTQCLYNHKLFDNCGCNTAKFPISQTECSYSGSLRSQAWLLGDNVCKDQRYSNRMYGKKCLCTSANFPHTSTATCSSPQTLLDDASKCSYQGVTRYERCKCDTAAGKYEFSSDKGYGWDCSKCSDAYGDHYKCTPKPCVEGSTSTSSCGTNEQLKDTGYKSGDAVCKICEIKSNCGFFKNANGTINIPDSACSWDTYGHTATVNVPSGKSYSNAWIRMWGDSTVNGDFTTATLIPGLVISNGGAYKQPRTITYKGRVTVTDTIRLEPGITTVKFEKGVCGNYKCEVWEAQSGRNQWRKLRDTTPGKDGCPYKASDCDDGCKNYFVNSDGTFSIPDGKCGWDAYGHTATISSGKPLNAEYETVWVRMWGPATIKNEIKTKNLRSGVVVSNVGSWNDPRTITFKDKVTISGVLETDPDVTTTKFDGGIYGNYVCKHIKAASGANKTQDMGVIQPGEKGCPCSMDRFAQTASTCNGILTGASCGGKYEKCETVENCATYDANRTQCTKCNSGYNLENGQCVKAATCSSSVGSYGCTNYGSNLAFLTCDGIKYCTTAGTAYTTQEYCEYAISGVGGFMPYQKCPAEYKYNYTNCSGTLGGKRCGMNYTTCSQVKDECFPCEASNCQTCESGSTIVCKLCKPGYVLTSSGNCIEDTSNPCNGIGGEFCSGFDPYGSQRPYCYNSSGQSEYAAGLNNGRTCWTCSAGYTLRCNNNSTPVSGCNEYKNGVCIDCYRGTLQNGKCVENTCSVANCKECVSGSSTSCKTCNDGYTPLFNLNGPTTCVKKPTIDNGSCKAPNHSCGNGVCCPANVSCAAANSGPGYMCFTTAIVDQPAITNPR